MCMCVPMLICIWTLCIEKQKDLADCRAHIHHHCKEKPAHTHKHTHANWSKADVMNVIPRFTQRCFLRGHKLSKLSHNWLQAATLQIRNLNKMFAPQRKKFNEFKKPLNFKAHLRAKLCYQDLKSAPTNNSWVISADFMLCGCKQTSKFH